MLRSSCGERGCIFGFASPLWLPGNLLLSFGRLWGWTLQWAVRGLEPLPHTAAPGPSASTPSASPAPTASNAPHPGCLQRSASAGASGAGEPGGAGRDVPVGSPRPRRMNGSRRAGEVQGLDRGLRGVLSHLHTPRPTQSGVLPRLRSPPSSRGARRGRELGRKESGKGGVGGRKAKAGGRRGRKRPPCARAGLRRVAARVAGPCNLGPPPGTARDGRDRSCPRGGPFPREVLGSL